MIRSIKLRLHPTLEQEEKMWQSVGTMRWSYNFAIERQEENYKNGGGFISSTDLSKEITIIKKTPKLRWLNEVSAQIPKQAIKDACKAYKKFFNGKAKKPRFKSRRRSKASFYNDNEKLKFDGEKFLLEKVGWVKVSECDRVISNKFLNPRIIHDGKYWYISIGTKISKAKNKKLNDVSLGIDVGIKELAVCSDGERFKNINKTEKVKKIKKKLKRFQRKVSRKYEMNKDGKKFIKTKNIIKLEGKIKLVHRKLRNIRENHIHQATTAIVRTKPSRIVVEDLNIQGMMKNKHLSKAISEQGLNKFKTILKYKCEDMGIEFVEADRFYPSSKLCSYCGRIKKDLKLKDRVYRCECGNEIDRDFQASINLSRYKSQQSFTKKRKC